MSEREFDKFSKSYEELLKDPVRDAFTVGRSDFFHVRKADLIRDYLRRRGLDAKRLSYLDVGCGKGELASLLATDFGRIAPAAILPPACSRRLPTSRPGSSGCRI